MTPRENKADNSPQPIRNLSIPTLVREAYDENDVLLAQDIWVKDKSQLERLKNLGTKYFTPAEKSEPEKGQDAEKSTDTAGTKHKKFESSGTELEEIETHYNQTLEKMEYNFKKAIDSNISFDQLQETFAEDLEYFIEEARKSPTSLSALNQLETYDDETFEHSLNVTILTILYGEFQDFSSYELKKLAYGGLFHDMGKTAIPHDIIHKPETLNEDEWEKVRNHPLKGRDILKEIGAEKQYQLIALEHHERPDGSGYPEGKKEINHYSRIVAVCDVYEALTASRVYKESRNPLKSFMILKDEFGDVERTRRIVSGLVHSLGIFPVGTLVKLSNNEMGIVKKIHPDDPRNPTVIVVTDRWERPLTTPVAINMKRVSSQKKGSHGEVYDDSLTIEQLIPLENHPELEGRVSQLIEKTEPVPI